MRPLSVRERQVLLLGGVAAGVLLVLGGVLLPWQAAAERRETRLATRRTQLVEARALAAEIAQLRAGSAAAEARLRANAPDQLAATIEGLVTTHCQRSSLVATRPLAVTPPAGLRQARLEVQLEKVRLEQLVRLLYAIDHAPAALQCDSLAVRARFEDASLLDVTLGVSGFARSTP